MHTKRFIIFLAILGTSTFIFHEAQGSSWPRKRLNRKKTRRHKKTPIATPHDAIKHLSRQPDDQASEDLFPSKAIPRLNFGGLSFDDGTHPAELSSFCEPPPPPREESAETLEDWLSQRTRYCRSHTTRQSAPPARRLGRVGLSRLTQSDTSIRQALQQDLDELGTPRGDREDTLKSFISMLSGETTPVKSTGSRFPIITSKPPVFGGMNE